jgi:hypothetical protein
LLPGIPLGKHFGDRLNPIFLFIKEKVGFILIFAFPQFLLDPHLVDNPVPKTSNLAESVPGHSDQETFPH